MLKDWRIIVETTSRYSKAHWMEHHIDRKEISSSSQSFRIQDNKCDTDEAVLWAKEARSLSPHRLYFSGNTCEGLKRSGKLHLKRDKYGSVKKNPDDIGTIAHIPRRTIERRSTHSQPASKYHSVTTSPSTEIGDEFSSHSLR
jgi:hypothetical protein